MVVVGILLDTKLRIGGCCVDLCPLLPTIPTNTPFVLLDIFLMNEAKPASQKRYVTRELKKDRVEYDTY